jgi:hypothetical protein
MKNFQTSLLREKFTISDSMPMAISDKEPVIALSNRLVVPLQSLDEVVSETFVVRAQNMHSCLRMAAHLAHDFYDRGSILERPKPYDWKYTYLAMTKGYEKKWNPDRWVAVYNKGRLLFEDGEVDHHPFLDIIEQCDARNKGDYEQSLIVAEDAFKQAGKMVNIDHDANVANIINLSPQEAKCGIILRGPNRTTTFNFTAREKAGRKIKPSQCMSVSAAFLEGIQLAFFIGMTNMKIYYELIEKSSDEARKSRDASSKLARLNGAISQFENYGDVLYRPDRPDFPAMIDEAEEFARGIFAKEIETKIQKGEEKDWIS